VNSHSSAQTLTDQLKSEARRLGFEACGVARATKLDEEARRLESWLHQSKHATMSWMEDHFDKRVDPRLLVDGAQSVVSVIENYYQSGIAACDKAAGSVSRYAWGDDYHRVLKKKLLSLLDWLSAETGTEINGRAFVDSAPVLDKVWAERSGIGWIGKNANLLRRGLGSYFFIGELIVDVQLEYDDTATNHCGSCTRCIDACPTDAIVEPYVVDSNRCISFLTIENREASIDVSLAERSGKWIFGCDVCQDVCPWNKFRKGTEEARYRPKRGATDRPLADWLDMSEAEFLDTFAGSPIRRAGYEGMRRNVAVAIANLEKES
jgi:epoxyqueuosine reductase